MTTNKKKKPVSPGLHEHHVSRRDTQASRRDKCDSLGGLHSPAGFLQTPLPFCASWCYHNPGPRVDLCGSWPPFPLAHVCVTLSAERPDFASCQVGEGSYSNVGNRKRKWTQPGLGERMEGTEYNIYPRLPSIIYKQPCHIFETVQNRFCTMSARLKACSGNQTAWPHGEEFLHSLAFMPIGCYSLA